MKDLVMKVNELSKRLSVKEIGVALSVVQTVLFAVMSALGYVKLAEFDAMGIAFCVTGAAIIVLSGAAVQALKVLFKGFNIARRYFPYYILDLVCGVVIGFVVACVVIQMAPATVCVYSCIRGRSEQQAQALEG